MKPTNGSRPYSGSVFAARAVPLVFALTFLSLILSFEGARAIASLDVSVGIDTSLDDGQQATFGSNPVVGLGVSLPLSDGGGRVFLDVARITASGSEFPTDPTFEMDDTKTRVMPLTFGFRASSAGRDPEARVRVWVGMAWQTLFTAYDPPDGDRINRSTTGLSLEVRPEIVLGPDMALWVRQRFSFARGIAFDDRLPDLDFGASRFEVGLEWKP